MELSNPCVGPSSRIKISFFLLSTCTGKLLSTPKKMTFLPQLPSGYENCERASNPVPQPIYPYLSGLAFLANITALNKQLPNVKSVFKSLDYVSSA